MFVIERYGNASCEREHRIIELLPKVQEQRCSRAIGTTEFVVKNYLRVIYDKLGLWNRLELALWYESRRGASHINPVTLPFWVKMKAALLPTPVVAPSSPENDISAPQLATSRLGLALPVRWGLWPDPTSGQLGPSHPGNSFATRSRHSQRL